MEQQKGYGRVVSEKIHYLKFSKQEINKGEEQFFCNELLKVSDKGISTVRKEIASLKPSVPVYFSRPASIERAARFFLNNFCNVRHKSDVLYSVKSNPEVTVLKHLFNSGIRHFDVASFSEVKLIDSLFGKAAKMYFMHPIKSREAIFEAYFNYGIRDFSLDSLDELKKLLEVTNNARDLGLHLRLSVSNLNSAIKLSGKFGIIPSKSISLARKTRALAKRFGICFHVGSQCMDPIEYRNAIMIVKDVVDKSKVRLDVLDIGGGFPSSYPGMTPAILKSYFDEIFDSIAQISLDADCKIWCEPGRALVAESGSLLVRIESRKGSMLYLNDGTYGGLFDAGFPGFIYPVRAFRIKSRTSLSNRMTSFGFYGPTCDALDVMKGPFLLPENISEGDYVEIGQLGAYSRSIRTDFNGFKESLQIEVSDEPLVSMYQETEEQNLTKAST